MRPLASTGKFAIFFFIMNDIGASFSSPRPLAEALFSMSCGLRSAPLTMTGEDHHDGGDGNGNGGPNVGIATRTRTRTRKPSLYKVLLLNDDYTPMEFVVHILQQFFRMDMEEATRVMLHVHQRGVGVCGVFSYEVAETKVNQVMDFARQNQHPLQCTLEKA